MSKCLIVTGGGRGIGAEVSRKAAKQGYSVCVNFHRGQTSSQKLVCELEENGANALTYQADVSREEEVEALFETVEKDLGTPEALVNNAGILDLQTRVDGMNAERIQRIFAVNVTGSFLCAREAVKRMSTKYGGKGGSIVNLSSGAAKYGSPGEYVDYAASKAAIDTLTIGLAREVAEEGIRVNAVRLGFIDTEIHQSGGEPDRMERVRTLVPMKRVGQADEVADAIMWLLSDKASYTTGTILDVSGGR